MAVRGRLEAPLAALLAAVVVLFWPATRLFFLGDDFGWLVAGRFALARPLGWWRAFTQVNAAGTYRPLGQQVFYWLGWHLFGMHPLGYHLLDLALFLASVVSVYRLARAHLGHPWLAAIAATPFALSVTHFDHLGWTPAVCETLAGLGVAGALLAQAGGRPRAAAIWYAVGLLADETAGVVPAMALVYDLLVARRPWRDAVRQEWRLWALASVYLPLRLAMGVHPTGLFAPVWSAGVWLGLIGRSVRTGLQFMGPIENVWRAGPVWRTATAAGSVALLAASLALAARAGQRLLAEWRLAAAGAAWFLLGLLPVLPFAHDFTTYNLDIPLLGFPLILAAALRAARHGATAAGAIWAAAFLAIGLLVVDGPGGLTAVDGNAVLSRAARVAYVAMETRVDRGGTPLPVCIQGGIWPQWVVGGNALARLLAGGAPARVAYPTGACPARGLVLVWHAATDSFTVPHV